MISLQINKLQRDEKKSAIYSYDQKFVREALKKKNQKKRNLELFPFAPPPKKIEKKVIVKIGHSLDTLLP